LTKLNPGEKQFDSIQSRLINRDENDKPIFDKYWTPDTDMSRYTDPEHTDFWQPDWVKD